MSLTLVDSERFDLIERVAELTLQGHSATAISKELKIRRVDVKELQDNYREILSKDSEARDMARDHLNMMAEHYNVLIKKLYELVDEIDSLAFSHQVAGQKNAAIKSIAELEAKRLDAFQKAGLLDSAELGDELAEAEEKREILLDILRNELCADCRTRVTYKISQVSGKAEVVNAEVIDG